MLYSKNNYIKKKVKNKYLIIENFKLSDSFFPLKC